jgi:hypothetical protein
VGVRSAHFVRANRERIVLAVAAAVLVAIVVLASAGGVRDDPRGADPTPTPTPAGERELFGGSLQPGVRYRTRAFVPALSFVVADTEWFVPYATQPDLLALERRNRTAEAGSERRAVAYLTFGRVSHVYRPQVRGLPASLIPAPADLHRWLRRHPDLRVGHTAPATVAGVPAESFPVEVRFRRPAHSDPYCRRRLLRTCALIGPHGSFPNGTRMRTIVLPTEPEPLVINLVGSSRRALAALEAPATAVLNSLRVGVR